jgi:TRAP-type transport system small permease protein
MPHRYETIAEDEGAPALPPPKIPVKIEEALGAAAMAAICLISFGNVVARYATNASFAFTEEFSVFLLVLMTFVGASLAFATDGHIRITFFRDRLGRAGRLICEAVSVAATTAMFSLILYYGAQLAYDQWYWGETSPGLGYPSWIYSAWLPALSLAILLRVLGRAWRASRARR